MGIFSRLRDIISSNINAMLDKAEDPEKLLRLMLQEMEDTLVEIKAQCAAAMAQAKTVSRLAAESLERARQWADKARLAVEKNRDDLAREALAEKRQYNERAESLEQQRKEYQTLIEQCQRDILDLEGRITSVREKQKILAQRHFHARSRRRAQDHIRRADLGGVMQRFDSFERRIDRMEAEADLVNFGRKAPLESKFAELEGDQEIEAELGQLRAEVKAGAGAKA